MSTLEADDETEDAAENTVLTNVLGNHGKVKILTVLLARTGRDLNATEIARLAGIDPSTFHEHVDDLLDYGLVVQTRTVGNSPMYQINRDSAAAEALAQFEWELLDEVEE